MRPRWIRHFLSIGGLCFLYTLYVGTISTTNPSPTETIQEAIVATTEEPDVPDPYEVYLFSTYYYPVSESMGNNGVGLYFIASYEWPDTVGKITVRASNNETTRSNDCKLEISVLTTRTCKLLGIFAGCFGLPNMTKLEISLGKTFYEVPFKTVSYEKKDVVTCVSPLFAAEQWHQIVFAAHVYRHFGSFMHLYIRSVVEPVYQMIKIYEKEGYLKAQPFPRLKFSSIPEYMYNPNQHVSFRAQEAAQSDCLLQYKESAQWVTFMDLDDILIPRFGSTYLEEFTFFGKGYEFIHYKKENVYYEASASPQDFSTFDIFHSARFLNVNEAGKIALKPKFANHTEIHTVERNRPHNPFYPNKNENVIVHLKKAYPMNSSGEEKKLWPYFFRNDTTIFNETDVVAIEGNYKRLSYKYPQIWGKLPSVGTYFPIILSCYNRKYYRLWATNPDKVKHCVNPDICRIPPKLVASCANAVGDFFSSEDGTLINVHYANSIRFIIEDRFLLYYNTNSTILDQFTLNCEDLLQANSKDLQEFRNWTITEKMRGMVEKQLSYHATHCQTYHDLLGFPKEPFSKEEAGFPLAYGILVYKDFLQVLLMLSGFYHPQNQYCLAVSGQAGGVFRGIMESLQKCFPNIHVLERPEVEWGGHEIMNSTYACFEYLAKSGKPWRYYQYLSGVDLPLKTNLEMVRILKTWNGSANMDIVPFENYRLMGKKKEDSPLPLFKSSVSVIISRETANKLVQSEVTKKLLEFLNGTSHSDESFWATIIGNKKTFPVPGAFEGSAIIAFREKYYKDNKKEVDQYKTKFNKHDAIKFSYYVTRMHVWDISPKACKGKFYLFSCVFGAEDLADLIKQPHFVAHKFHMDYQPAGLICGLKVVRQRTLKGVPTDTTPYEEIPYVQLHKGVSLLEIKHPLWLFGETFRES